MQKPEVKLQEKILVAKDFQLDAAHGCATQALPEVWAGVRFCQLAASTCVNYELREKSRQFAHAEAFGKAMALFAAAPQALELLLPLS